MRVHRNENRLWVGPFAFEWVFWRWDSLGVGFYTYGNQRTLFVKTGLFGLYFGWDGKGEPDRDLSLRIHDGMLWWSLWMSHMEHNSDDPKWRRGSFDPRRLILGKRRYSETPLSEVTPVVVNMPEGNYAGQVTLYEARWKRSRWPFVLRVKRAEIHMSKPIPIPGKGENSWDMDDDAIYDMSTPAETVQEAIDSIRASAMRTREKYGWRSSDV